MSEASEKAYREIRQRIQNGELQPGDRLVERSLCAEFEMSRTPVREALRRLNAEGLAKSRPNCGMEVARLTRHEVGEMFEVGLLIESYMASLAAEKRTLKGLRRLQALLEAMRDVVDDRRTPLKRYIELDRKFHEAVADMADNPRLSRMLVNAMDARVLHQTFVHYSTAQLQQSLAQHETLFTAIESGASEWAASAMRTHILSGRAASSAATSVDGDGSASLSEGSNGIQKIRSVGS